MISSQLELEYSETSASGYTTCTICLDEFQNNDSIVRLRCFGNHIFHKSCIRDWFREQFKCPVCNYNLTYINTTNTTTTNNNNINNINALD